MAPDTREVVPTQRGGSLSRNKHASLADQLLQSVLLLLLQVDVGRFMSDGQRLAELIQAFKLQHQQEQLQELLEGEI